MTRTHSDRRINPTWRQAVEIFIRVLEEKDPYTRGHSERVQKSVVLLAEHQQWDPFLRECASIAALLHDIGKILIETSTLRNQLPHTTYEQRNEIFDHPYNGATLVRGIVPLEVQEGILGHHERWDGKVKGAQHPGYPFGRKGEQISIIARAIAIADTYDAMTTQRSYNVPMPAGQAAAVLTQSAGTRFDPHLAQVFVHHVIPLLAPNGR